MLLLSKYFYKTDSISSSSLIIFFSVISTIGFFYFKILVLVLLIDVYLYNLLSNYKVTQSDTSSSCKIEIVAEGQKLAETNDLAKMVDHYGSKFVN